MRKLSDLQSQIQSKIEKELNLGKWVLMGSRRSGHWGHKGRPGKRGGSARSKGKGLASKKLTAPSEPSYTILGKNIYDPAQEKLGDWMSENVLATWETATEKERSELKAQVARDLAAASGVTEQEAADFVEQWAHSSNDDDMRSLAIQQDAAKEFGVELSNFTKGKIDAVETEDPIALGGKPVMPGSPIIVMPDGSTRMPGQYNPLMESDKQRAILRSMYNETQAELKARGITEVRLYRGVGMEHLPDPSLTPPEWDIPSNVELGWSDFEGRAVPIATNAIESWSIGNDIATNFAQQASHFNPSALVLEAVIPAERILCTPATGFGCLTEGEVIVLGGISGDQAYIKTTIGA